jgi:hypothetical protein
MLVNELSAPLELYVGLLSVDAEDFRLSVRT